MPFLLPLSFLLLQAAVLLLLPRSAAPVAYLSMVAAPLGAALAAALRGRAETGPARMGWWAIALSLTVWSAGAFGNLWQELILGHVNEMYRGSMLAFNLTAVPITFVLATDWRAGRRLVRVIDATLALALGYGYFLYTWAVLTAHGAPDDAGIAAMIRLLDVQNLFLVVGAVSRRLAADDDAERALFAALTAYAVPYLALIFYNNHYLATSGPEGGTVINIAFALIAAHASQRPAPRAPRPARRTLARAVRSASPMVLTGALLIVSLFLIRVDYAFGAAGILIAVIGYGWRSTLTQVRTLERGDTLQREHTQLQAIVWTDALTGIPNRRFIDQALAEAPQRDPQAGRPLAVLMIDIDHFKRLNDRAGHVAGDACLRTVAHALQAALARPGDVLARYGGEEFIALLHDADAEGARVVAERLRAAVERLQLPHPDSPDSVVTVSVGVAAATLHDEADALRLIEGADRALYRAKDTGRNCVAGAYN